MTDIIKRAEAVLQYSDTRISHALVRDLVAALQAARVENGRLLADAEMWRGTQSMYRKMDKR